MTDTTPPAVWVDGDPLMEAIAAAVWEHCARDDEDMPQAVCDDPRNIAAVAAAVVRAAAAVPVPAADRATVLEEAADAVFALDYDVMVGEEGDENLGSMREAWDLGTIHADKLLRRMADEAAAGRVAADTPPAFGSGHDSKTSPKADPKADTCAHCGTPVRRITGTLTAWWVHDPGGNTVCHPQDPAGSTRAEPGPVVPAQPGEEAEMPREA